MTERASLLQTVQVGVESTSGTAVNSGKMLGATSIEASVMAEVKKFKPTGQKFNTLSAMGKEWTEADISGVLSYTDWVYLTASGIQYTAPDQQEATAAYLWAALPSQTAVDTVKTYTVEIGGAVRAHEFAYGLITNLGYTITRDECTVKGKMIGQVLSDGITMTSTPTAIDIVPVMPDDVSFYMDTLYGDIGETKLTRVLSIDFDTGERFKPVWAVDAANASFAAHVEAEPNPVMKIKLEADSVGMGLLATMRTGAKKFIRVQAVGATIEGAYSYKWTHDLCVTVTNIEKFEDDEGVYAIGFELTATYDSDLAKAYSFETVNALTTL